MSDAAFDRPHAFPDAFSGVLTKVRAKIPLIHNVTNFVAMNTTANALLAVGASPVMAHAREEVEDFAGMAGAVVLNIGTLSPDWVESMTLAVQAAHRKNVPVVLDPVGGGVTEFRRRMTKKIMMSGPIRGVRGNASEIVSLGRTGSAGRGVDSVHDSRDALHAAKRLATQFQTTVTVSGADDYVTDGARTLRISNGHPMMTKVTGLGCVASAIAGACLAVEADALTAMGAAMAIVGVCGEHAARMASGPGSLQMHFMDSLSLLQPDDLRRLAKVEEL